MSAFNEYGAITRLGLRHARGAFGSQERVSGAWRELNYHAEPDYPAALEEYDAFAELLAAGGCEIVWLPTDERLSIDSLYVRDATLATPKGLLACAMGKAARAAEPEVALAAYGEAALPLLGALSGAAKLEGGDVVWLDAATCIVGEGYRTNAEGIAQLRALLGPEIQVVAVPLPHYKGPSDVFHLMSMLSPVDADLAVVYSPLLPVPFRDWLIERGLSFVEVPEEEFASMACNVLAIAPRRVVMLDGNPLTRQRLEAAGCEVLTYKGEEISRKGEGGPTCLTRPLVRR